MMQNDFSDKMQRSLDMQIKQYEEFMHVEQIRHCQDIDMFSTWVTAQREMED